MTDLTALPPLPFPERRWSRMSMSSIQRQTTHESTRAASERGEEKGGESVHETSYDPEKQSSSGIGEEDAIRTSRPPTVVSSRGPADPVATDSDAEPEYEYPGAKTVAFVILAIMLAVFLMALDRTIIATAVPSITDEFNSLGDIGWYASAYMLTGSCFQLMLGRVYSFYPPKWVFLAVITIFEIGSAVCAAAPSSIAFIIGRAVAGLGSAGIMSGNIILLTSVVPLAKRPIYMGFFGALMGVSSVIGPLLGGALTSDVSWRWCFYINLPIGGFAMLVIFFILPAMPPVEPNLSFRQQLSRLDIAGQTCLFPSIICLLIALQWGGSTYAWSNGRIIALLVVFGVTFIGFILVQIFMQKTATISARVIKNRSIISGLWYNVCVGCVIIVMVYYIALWFQAIKGKSAVESGIATIPLMLSMVVGAVGAGQLTGRIGYYNPSAITCCVIMPIGIGLITTWTPSTDSGYWIGYQVIFGFGLGAGIQQGAMAAQTVLQRKDVPMGVSLMMFGQQISGAIFISVAQNVFDKHLISGFTPLLQSISPGSTVSPSQIVGTGATDIRTKIPAQYLPVVLPVYNDAIREVFYLPLAMACLASIGGFTFEWRSVKAKRPADEEEEDDGDVKVPQQAEAPVEVPLAVETEASLVAETPVAHATEKEEVSAVAEKEASHHAAAEEEASPAAETQESRAAEPQEVAAAAEKEAEHAAEQEAPLATEKQA